MNNWKKAQNWELDWWGNCTNTFGEEYKQFAYARCMGLKTFHNGKSPFNIDLNNASILDIGGGATSLLLKCVNHHHSKVVDPLKLPDWVIMRYQNAGIDFLNVTGESFNGAGFDEAWIYNCLQHTQNPELIIENAKQAANLIRIFEWIDTPTNEGHPHSLTKENLDTWLDGYGKVDLVNENTAVGKAYYGIFPKKSDY